jgi:hypothetical protein
MNGMFRLWGETSGKLERLRRSSCRSPLADKTDLSESIRQEWFYEVGSFAGLDQFSDGSVRHRTSFETVGTPPDCRE